MRAAVLAMCGLMLVVQPVFASVGELHELAHDPSGRHHSLPLEHASAQAEVDQHASDAQTQWLHVLVDAAHSCGPGALPPWVGDVAPAVLLPALHPRVLDRFPRRCLPAPFKPPIDA